MNRIVWCCLWLGRNGIGGRVYCLWLEHMCERLLYLPGTAFPIASAVSRHHVLLAVARTQQYRMQVVLSLARAQARVTARSSARTLKTIGQSSSSLRSCERVWREPARRRTATTALTIAAVSASPETTLEGTRVHNALEDEAKSDFAWPVRTKANRTSPRPGRKVDGDENCRSRSEGQNEQRE